MLFNKRTNLSKWAIRAISVLLLISLSIGMLVACGDDEVDFLSDDLSEYISISESDYKSFPVTNVLDEYSEEHLIRKINKILAEKRGEAQNDGLGVRKVPITLGDTVSIYYRGYMLDENGKAVEIASNFNLGADEFVVGEGKFTPYEIEEALIGKVPDDYGKFFKTTTGTVAENQVLYISYYSYSESLNKNITYERLDLSRTDIDAEYGEGFREFLLSSEIGKTLDTKDTFKRGDEAVQYQALVINFATDFENSPLTVDVVLPNNYEDVSLRGKSAIFDVYIDYSIVYDTGSFDEDFILNTLKVEKSVLDKYDGANTVEQYKNLLRQQIREEINAANEYLIIEDMWAHYNSKVKVLSLPQGTVESYYNDYYNEVNTAYLSDSSGYNSIDEYAVGYLNYNYNLGIQTGGDWRTALRKFCESTITEKLVFYYIIREEGFLPNSEEYTETYNEVFQEHLNYYLSQNQEQLETLEGDAYSAFVEDLSEDILEYYGEDYFREQTHYRFGVKKLISFAKMS